MREYMVRYVDTRGKYHDFYVMADSREQAKEKAHHWMSPMPSNGKVVMVEIA